MNQDDKNLRQEDEDEIDKIVNQFFDLFRYSIRNGNLE